MAKELCPGSSQGVTVVGDTRAQCAVCGHSVALTQHGRVIRRHWRRLTTPTRKAFPITLADVAVVDRFFIRNVVVRSDLPTTRGEPCWEWTGSLVNNGYGQVGRHKKRLMAHRYLFDLMVADIPDAFDLDHLCRFRRCVNPAHMEPVTRRENLRRGDRPSRAFNTSKTHCPHGHPYDEKNTYHGNGRRHCRTCARERARVTRLEKGGARGP